MKKTKKEERYFSNLFIIYNYSQKDGKIFSEKNAQAILQIDSIYVHRRCRLKYFGNTSNIEY